MVVYKNGWGAPQLIRVLGAHTNEARKQQRHSGRPGNDEAHGDTIGLLMRHSLPTIRAKPGSQRDRL